MKDTKLNDGAKFALRNLLRSDVFPEIWTAWEGKAPGITIISADGRADLAATALTGARAEGFRAAMKTFLTLSE